MKKICFLMALAAITVIAEAQNVGIGTNTPTAQLHTTGTVRHAALSGNGTRPVYADGSGNLLMTIPVLPPSSVTNSTSQPIPDFNCTWVSSNIVLAQLPASVSSATIRITVNITHAKAKDLIIYLTAPNGSIINLYSTLCESGNNLINTTFTDTGDSLFCYANLTGDYIPKGSLAASVCGITPTVSKFSAIGGGTINPNGTWILRVIDNTTTNTGTLNNWTVSINSGIGVDGLWSLKGNSGTNANNFLGTTDDSPLRFKIRNTNSGRIDSAGRNTGIGFRSLDSIFSGQDNVAFGYYALKNNKTGAYNTAIGTSALEKHTSGDDNTVVGSYAMYFSKNTGSGNSVFGSGGMLNTTTGSYNTAIGFITMNGNSTGTYNTAVGSYALYGGIGNANVGVGVSALSNNYYQSNIVAVGDSALFNNGGGGAGIQDAKWNTAVGSKSLFSNTFGSGNTAHGYHALYYNTSGFSNTAIGAYALHSNTNRSGLVAIGDSALFNNGLGTTQDYEAAFNTAVGSKSLFANVSGYANTALGYGADVVSGSLTNSTAIGYNAKVSQPNFIQLGDPNVATVNTYGDLTVRNGKGIIRSNDGTQQKKLTTEVVVNVFIGAGATVNVPFSFSETFSSPPDVYVGNATGGGGFAEKVMTVAGVSTTGGFLFVYNPGNNDTPNYSVKIVAIGPQ